MLNFLKQSRQLLTAKEPICIVIGNESCDLDSAVSALCLAYFYHKLPQEALSCNSKKFLPMLNIPRKDFALKTEVTYLLANHEITSALLTFRDELEENALKHSEFILVDHHVTPFALRCVEVLDHRPYDAKMRFPFNCKVQIEPVGSCATLVAEKIINLLPRNSDKADFLPLVSMLRSTIVLDTVNFSPTAQRATNRDVEVCAALEHYMDESQSMVRREELFLALSKARSDISSLSLLQLLRKDLKFLSNPDGSMRISLCGFPILAKDFIAKPDAEAAVKEFAKEYECSIVLLIGMYIDADGEVKRDLGVINIKETDSTIADIVNVLTTTKEPALELEQHKDCNFLNGCFFKQNNIRATRKHILPIIKNALGHD